MLRLFLYLLLLFYFSVNCVAQKSYYSKNMLVTDNDLQGTSYSKDSTANAFYIYEKGYTRFENGGNYNLLTDYERKLKIINKKGYPKAKIEIYLYKSESKKEKIRNIVAHTYNIEEGKTVKTKVSKENIFTEEFDEEHNVVRFTFPNVKPGSVLKYTYQLESPFIFNFNGWNFQDDIPKMYSEYVTDLPGNYLYNIKLVGPLKLKEAESNIIERCIVIEGVGKSSCSHNKYTMEDVPAFEEEKYMTAKKNYFSRVAYELKEYRGFDGTHKKFTKTWTDVDNKLKKHVAIGLQLKKINTTKDLLPLDISSSSTNLEKAKKIYTYLTKNYTWDKKYQIFSKTNIKEIIKTKTGNIGSINILLHNVLKKQGFSVKPILLSTRENGYATKIHPVLFDFNYILVQLTINDKTYLLDATEKDIPFSQIPFRCLNKYGRLLDLKNGSSWIDITSKNRSVKYYREQIKLTPENKLQTTCKYVYSGYYALNKRKALSELSEEKKLTSIGIISDQVEIISKKIIDEDIIENPVVEEFSFKAKTEEIDGILYIKPFTKPFFKENPFKLNERSYPVDFGYKKSFNYLVSIEIPKNYTFLDIPKNTEYLLPDNLGRLVTNYRLEGNKLLIAHKITLLATYYSPEFYEPLKNLFNYIVDIENNTVITVKKD